MTRMRSSVPLVLGILHLVGGGLGLILSGCAGIGVLFRRAAQQQGGPLVGDDLDGRIRAYQIQNVPGFEAFEAGSVLAGAMLDLILVAAGIGLILYHDWARWVSFGYAVLSILHKIVLIGYRLYFIVPALNAFLADHLPTDPAAQQPGFATGIQIGILGTMCFEGVFVIYPIVVFILLMMPSVARSFDSHERGRTMDDDLHDR